MKYGDIMTTIQTSTVTIKQGETLHYRLRPGIGTPILLIHGNMMSSFMFESLMSRIDESFDVYALDLRGFGQSTYENTADDVLSYAIDVKQFIEALSLDQPVVGGFEFGGLVALKLAADFKFHASALLLMSSLSVAGRPMRRRTFFNLIKTKDYMKSKPAIEKFIDPIEKYKTLNQRWYVKQMFSRDVFTQQKPNNADYEQYIDDFLAQRNLADIYMAMTYFNIFSDDNGVVEGEHKAKDISIPVICLHGDQNNTVPIGAAHLNARAIGKNASVEILNGVAHVMFIDDIRASAKAINTFLTNEGFGA